MEYLRLQWNNMFHSSQFSFFGHFSVWKYYLTFVYILEGTMGKKEKKERKSRN